MMFAIFNKYGAQICIQKASSAEQAVGLARMYGYRAVRAEAVA